MLNVLQEAPGHVHRDLLLSVILQPFRRHPLQRGPAVWRIPLLAAIDGGGRNTARLQQARRGCRGDFIGPVLRRRLHVKREQGCRRELIAYLLALEIVIRVPALFIIPQVALDGFLTRRCQRLVFTCAGGVATLLACPRQQFFHLEHQGVQVHGDNAGGPDGAELLRIVHPARAKVPARGRSGTQITVDLGRRPVRVTFGGIHVVKP